MTLTDLKHERTDGHSLNGERVGIVSDSVPTLICVYPYHWDPMWPKTIMFVLVQ